MTHPAVGSPEDDALIAELRSVASRADGPPPLAFESAYAALATRTLDAELAELVRDSLTDAGALVRGVAAPTRLLSFEVGDAAVEVEVEATEDVRMLVGQLVGRSAVEVFAEHPGGAAAAEVDEVGRFTVEVPAGRVRLRFVAEDGRAVVTSWVSV